LDWARVFVSQYNLHMSFQVAEVISFLALTASQRTDWQAHFQAHG